MSQCKKFHDLNPNLPSIFLQAQSSADGISTVASRTARLGGFATHQNIGKESVPHGRQTGEKSRYAVHDQLK